MYAGHEHTFDGKTQDSYFVLQILVYHVFKN